MEAWVAGQATRTLAAKLNDLFATKKRPDGKEYSNEQVAEFIVAGGYARTASQSYIWGLRNGTKTNPTKSYLEGLAAFFEVPVAYFFDDDNELVRQVDQQLEALKAERARMASLSGDEEIQLLAMRAGQLSPERLKLVKDMLELVYQQERAERPTPPDGGLPGV
ncbi:XRE family transcriptional regulator [Amycolatopsis roodepoortensis]|uniref:XRE family transcriptional regulator n=1 Tax=Amycolatopsis roodepoortensis TaxID=700274 RepID=UPI00214AA838|nr:XRE family transcriptional regulator [Amycolatopsis roodepoortensis]UUV36012.1 XRE family transcriptional regulator [Amycolatopsis roodepoortensis]